MIKSDPGIDEQENGDPYCEGEEVSVGPEHVSSDYHADAVRPEEEPIDAVHVGRLCDQRKYQVQDKFGHVGHRDHVLEGQTVQLGA